MAVWSDRWHCSRGARLEDDSDCAPAGWLAALGACDRTNSQGQVSCAWERSNGILRLEAAIPSNTTAVLDLGDGSRLLEPGRHRIEAPEPAERSPYPYPFTREV